MNQEKLIPKLWCFKKNSNQSIYFLVGVTNCDSCGNLLDHYAYHFINWHPKHLVEKVFCVDCVLNKRFPRLFHSQERRYCLLADNVSGLPFGSFPVSISHHGFNDSKVTNTFEAAKVDSLKTIDNTKLSGRPDGSWLCSDGSKVLIGVDPVVVDKDSEARLESFEKKLLGSDNDVE